MEAINKILSALIDGFDLPFMLSVNVLTYLIIKEIDVYNKQKKVKTWTKRIVTILCGSSLAVFFYFVVDVELKILIYSFILSLVSWDFIFKPLLKIIKSDYNK